MQRSRATKRDAVFFSSFIHQSKTHFVLGRHGQLRYDVTGQELSDKPETMSWLAVTNTG